MCLFITFISTLWILTILLRFLALALCLNRHWVIRLWRGRSTWTCFRFYEDELHKTAERGKLEIYVSEERVREGNGEKQEGPHVRIDRIWMYLAKVWRVKETDWGVTLSITLCLWISGIYSCYWTFYHREPLSSKLVFAFSKGRKEKKNEPN